MAVAAPELERAFEKYIDRIESGFNRLNVRMDDISSKLDRKFEELAQRQTQMEIRQASFVTKDEIKDLVMAVDRLRQIDPDNLKASRIGSLVLSIVGSVVVTLLTAFLLIKFGLK